MNIKRMIFAAVCCCGLGACAERHREGTAERAGRHVDETMDDIRDSADRTGKNLRDAGRDLRDRTIYDENNRSR